MRLVVAVFLVCLFLCPARAGAFHEKEGANCDGCHNLKSSTKEKPVDRAPHRYMLREAQPSDICLSCHATELGAVFSDDILSPAPEKGGGNFIFLMEDNLNDVVAGAGAHARISGDAAGHNVIAPNHGIAADPILRVAPGGEFDSEWLGCTSCHDPHGNANFRMLYGIGPVQEGVYTFTQPAPLAEGISLFFGSESNDNHTAYRSGMSEWCANCHGDFHNTNYPRVLTHASGSAIGTAVAAIYNLYNGTTDPTGGSQANAYLAQVPFEDEQNTISSTSGPSANSTIMCLSCHRAHASSAPDAGRWDFNVTRLADDGNSSGSHALSNPYDANQSSLCNKCHAKDADDALLAREP